jgi:hypothetical protein
MSYLIFSSKEEAVSRSEQAGADAGLAYHAGYPQGSRYVWGVHTEDTEDNPRTFLNISGHQELLTPEEQSALVDELPADWQHDTEI